MATQTLEPMVQPSFILLDSSTQTCSVSLYRGVVELYHNVGQGIPGSHIASLAQMLEEAMIVARQSGISLSACVLSGGPGSYTGLRIASSLAKGVCHGYNIPLIAISTLELLMAGYRKQRSDQIESGAYLVPMMKAKGSDVFWALFDAQGLRLTDDELSTLSMDRLRTLVPEQDAKFHFIGQEAQSYSSWTEDANVFIVDDIEVEAAHMSEVALQRWQSQQFVSLAYWKPNYLKEYVAVVAKNKVLAGLHD